MPHLLDRHRCERVSRQVGSDLQKPDGVVVITKEGSARHSARPPIAGDLRHRTAWSSGCTAPAFSLSPSVTDIHPTDRMERVPQHGAHHSSRFSIRPEIIVEQPGVVVSASWVLRGAKLLFASYRAEIMDGWINGLDLEPYPSTSC